MAMKDYSDSEAVRSRGQDLVSTTHPVFILNKDFLILRRPQKEGLFSSLACARAHSSSSYYCACLRPY